MARFRSGESRRVDLAVLLAGFLVGAIIDYGPGRQHQKLRFMMRHAALLCAIERVSGESLLGDRAVGHEAGNLDGIAAGIRRLWREVLGPTTAYLIAPIDQPAYLQMPVLGVSGLTNERVLEDLGIVVASRNMAVKTTVETLRRDDPDAVVQHVHALCDSPYRQYLAKNAAGARATHPTVLPLWGEDLSALFRYLFDWYAADAPEQPYGQTAFGVYGEAALASPALSNIQRHVTWLIPLEESAKGVSRLALRWPVDDQARPDRVFVEDGALVVRGTVLAKPIITDFKEAGMLTGDPGLPYRSSTTKEGASRPGSAATLGTSTFSVGKAGEMIYGSHDGNNFLVRPSPAAAMALARRHDLFGDLGTPSHLYFFGMRTDTGKTLSEHALIVPAPMPGGQVFVDGVEVGEGVRLRLLSEAVRTLSDVVKKAQEDLKKALTILLRESVRGEAVDGKADVDIPKALVARRAALVSGVDGRAVRMLGDAVAAAPLSGDAARWKDDLVRAWTAQIYDVAQSALESAAAELAVRNGVRARAAAAMALVAFARGRLKATTGNTKPSATDILTIARSTVNQTAIAALKRATTSAAVLRRALNDSGAGGVVFDNRTCHEIVRAMPQDLPLAYWRLAALADLPADDDDAIAPLWLAIMRGMAAVRHVAAPEGGGPGFGAALSFAKYPAARLDALVGGDAARMAGEVDAVTSFLKSNHRQSADWTALLALGMAVAEDDRDTIEAVRDHIVRDYALADAGVYAKRQARGDAAIH